MNEWCIRNDKNNFIYEHFDDICDICAATDTTLQLSSTFRHSSIYDSNDKKNTEEKKLMHELIERANAKNVQVIVEGFGYSSIDKIKENVETHRSYCPDTPFYTSIPAVLDMAMPYTNTSRTIGSSIAGYYGASLLCYDMLQKEIINNNEICRRDAVEFNISALAVNLAKGHMDTVLRNNASYKANKENRLKDLLNLSIDPEEMEKFLKKRLDNPLIIGKTVII